jgi:hypothetical protein
MSPCCSIGEKTISLTPFIHVRSSFFENPYFKEDLTRINREMEPRQAVSTEVWDPLGDEEKQKRLQVGTGYAFLSFFVYECNDLFQNYPLNAKKLGKFETNYYMIDFRNIYKVDCDKIIAPRNAPLNSKCLQLSIETRGEPRNKIAYYYSRIPDEDKVILGD